MFKNEQLSEELKQELINKKIWAKSCPVDIERLRIITVSYIDFDGNSHDDGKLICLDVVALSAIDVFRDLYEMKFPLAKINIINDYDGDDDASMEDNSCACFNYRDIANSTLISIHSYGLAIDINPIQNPFVMLDHTKGMAQICPIEGTNYMNRLNMRKGMVTEKVIAIFKKYGFTVWGGNWNTPLDYHHFQPTRDMAEQLAAISYEEGCTLWKLNL